MRTTEEKLSTHRGRCEVARRSGRWLSPPALLLLVCALGGGASPGTAQALPSFARQTGFDCSACHEPYPQLNEFGRNFKLMGYTQQMGDVAFYKRFAAMIQPSFTHTKADQAAADSVATTSNNNLVVNESSLFYGGRIFDKLGAFVQATYSGPDDVVSWDLADIRYADRGTLAGKSLIYGVDVNNTPTVQDPWNSTPVWGFPFSSSVFDPGLAAPLIAGGLDGTVAGLGAYTMWSQLVYAEVNVYKTLGPDFLNAMGVTSTDFNIDGVVPYWRVALQHKWGLHHIEVGTVGLHANVYPGNDRSAGTTDEYLDTGVDMQYQFADPKHFFTGRLSWIHEDQTLDASFALGAASNRHNHLDSFGVSGTYLYDQTWGLDVGYNQVAGSSDAALLGGSPDSDYVTLQADWLPFNKSGGPEIWPWFNPKLSLQYTIYDKVNGTSTNASDNNTLYLQAWLTF